MVFKNMKNSKNCQKKFKKTMGSSKVFEITGTMSSLILNFFRKSEPMVLLYSNSKNRTIMEVGHLVMFSYDILYYFITKIIYLYCGSIVLTLDRFLL